jgi:2'-5' RNA ligase
MNTDQGHCQSAAPVTRSAIIITPPQELWEPIQAIRRAHDKSFERWMPHINLVYGFIPDAYFPEAAALIADALASFGPFTVTLRAFADFEHPSSHTLWLRPEAQPEGALHRLQATLQSLFPRCDELSRRSEQGFQPHLTVGQAPNKAAAQALTQAWQRDWEQITFTVDSVALISRRDDEPFVVRHVVPLSSGDDPRAQADRSVRRIQLGRCLRAPVEWAFDRVEQVLRLCLFNADESGSMASEMHQNALAFDAAAAAQGDAFDVVIFHDFGSDSAYRVFTTAGCAHLFAATRGSGLSVEVEVVASPQAAVKKAKKYIKGRTSHGTTCPKSHPKFLGLLVAALDQHAGTVDLTVLSTSDGGFDGNAPQREIHQEMMKLTSRCRCQLAANVLVGSSGSPDALRFFTGDPERFEARLLLSTVKAAPGVLLLRDFKGADLASARAGEGEGEGAGEARAHVTVQPAIPFWRLHEGHLLAYWPTGEAPPQALTLRRYTAQPGGREAIFSATLPVEDAPVGIDASAQEVFGMIAQSLSANPYLRDSSRQALNHVMAQLEGLLSIREQVLTKLTASPDEQRQLQAIEGQLDANLQAITRAQRELTSPRALSASVNALNNARRLLKQALRESYASMQQRALERELAHASDHPDHWTVWLQPAVAEIQAQLTETQQDVGGAMQHLSTRIRSRKSREDGATRAIDRYVERLQERARAGNDRAERKADPRDREPIEQPARWLHATCPITGQPLTEGVVGLPFVADRRDITSGNVASGGQNVDRMPIAPEPMLSLTAARALMWAPNGQMATPFCTPSGVYNAVIPALIGPATPASLRALRKAIGWLCTGTSGFEAPMAEALPGALGALLGSPRAEGGAQAQALLRTTALFQHLRSYPYVANTATLDESATKLPLPDVWYRSVSESPHPSLQSHGCTTSLLAKAVGARYPSADALAAQSKDTARGLLAWCCRNIARSILSHASEDGCGGVEGIRRLSACLFLSVELDGFPSLLVEAAQTANPESTPPAPAATQTLSADDLAHILGPRAYSLWSGPATLTTDAFLDAFNAWLGGLPRADMSAVIDDLNGIFSRLDARTLPPITPEDARATSPTHTADADTDAEGGEVTTTATARLLPITHTHFGILSLEAVEPRRYTSPTPRLASQRLSIRRMMKAAEVQWIAPRDAHLPEGALNPSALAYLNAHTALYPLRALLRLRAANLLGHDALCALRQSPEATPIPPVDDVIGAMADLLGGMEEVALIILRAFAFVVANANGYADRAWSESPLRQASWERAADILKVERRPVADPTRYGPDTLDLATLSLPIQWPQMVGRGYLPRSRAVDSAGHTVTPPLTDCPEVTQLTDQAVCQRSFAHIIAPILERYGDRFIGGLHRHARGVLGAQAYDLNQFPAAAQQPTILQDLVPRLAGRVRGTPEHPEFFLQCAYILWAMTQLGGDTRTLRAEEPEGFLHAEAQVIRAACGAPA